MEVVQPKEGSTSEGFYDNQDLIATDKLKIAKWENAFEGTSISPRFKPAFAEKDADQIYYNVISKVSGGGEVFSPQRFRFLRQTPLLFQPPP